MMYLMLSVAGHLTIFQTRTRGPWWSIRPARILLLAVVGTQTVATLICIFGFLVTPLWWGWAAFVWGYAFAWFLVTDPVKLLAYRILDPVKALPKSKAKVEAKTEIGAEPKLEAKAKAGPNSEAKAALQSETKAAPKSEAETEPEPAVKANSKANPNPDTTAHQPPPPTRYPLRPLDAGQEAFPTVSLDCAEKLA